MLARVTPGLSASVAGRAPGGTRFPATECRERLGWEPETGVRFCALGNAEPSLSPVRCREAGQEPELGLTVKRDGENRVEKPQVRRGPREVGSLELRSR